MRLMSLLLLGLFLTGACSQEDAEPQNTPYQLEAPFYFGEYAIPTDNPMTQAGVELGRMLFYEKKLSQDNSISCASCHQQEKAFSDGNQFSLGVDGQTGTRNSMSLQNLLWSVPRFFWDGRAISLEEQALVPIQDPVEMHQSLESTVEKLENTAGYPKRFELAFDSPGITPERIAKALAQFQRTLISSNSRYDRYLRQETQFNGEEEMGLQLFFTHPVPSISLRGGNCGDCHMQFLTSGARDGLNGFHNNGLDSLEEQADGLFSVTGNPEDRGRFKAPTLRNIALTAPYMHDGRFQTLEEVLDHYNDHIHMSPTLDVLIQEASNLPIDTIAQNVRLHLTESEKSAILAFLNTLTDSTFINNPKFSNPFTDD